jgi:hypothetical protein
MSTELAGSPASPVRIHPSQTNRKRTNQENEKQNMKAYLYLIPAAALLALAACKTTQQMTSRPDFLSTYDHLEKVEPGVWRYVSQPLLANCNKFIVSPVKVLFTEFEGKPVTAEQRQRTSDFVRQAIVKAVSERYPVVSDAGPDVAEIRVAITGAYRTGGKLGLCVQGEILDNSNTQVAAAIRSELSELYVPNWEDKATARKMVEDWAQRLVKAIDQAHGK